MQADGRLTNQALSDQVALSPSACLARVRQLENAGVIQGYHARLDPFMVDVGIVLFAEVTLKAHGAEDLARFDAVIADIPQIVEASHVSGDYDYLLKVVVADLDEWTRIGRTSDHPKAARIASTRTSCCASPRSSSAIP